MDLGAYFINVQRYTRMIIPLAQVRNVLRGKFGYLQEFVLETGEVQGLEESGDVDIGDGGAGGGGKRGDAAIQVSFSIKVLDWATEGALQDKKIHPQKASIASWAFSCLEPADEGGTMLAGKANVDEMLSREGWVGMSEEELEELWQGDWAGLQIQVRKTWTKTPSSTEITGLDKSLRTW